jgi:hypothetical protein
MEAYRGLIAEKPREFAEIGGICLNARDVYLDTLNGFEREPIKLRLAEIEQELSAPSDGAMERLLIGHVVLCWLRLMMVDRGYTCALDQSITLTLGAYWEKRLSAAQKRFTRSVENLARVRKLMRRAVTVVAVNNSGSLSRSKMN